MKYKTRTIYLIPIVLLLSSLTLANVGPHLPGAQAQSPNRVGLVVRFGDGSLVTRCVEFSEPEISGYDVLTRSGLNVVAAFDSGMGAAICAIEGTGCPVESCLTCAQPDYWSYWHLVDGAWVYSQSGSSIYQVHDGDVEGWSWGAGNPPPQVSFDQICTPPATDTPPPTDTPIPTHTPLPTATSVPPTNTPSPPTATPPPPTPMVWFRVDANPIPAGTCTTIRWDTANTQAIYLNGEQVSANGTLEICPTAHQEYHLRVVSAAGEQTHELVVGVTGAATATPSPQQTAPVVPSSTPVSHPTVTAPRSPSPSPSPSSTPSPPSTTQAPARTTATAPTTAPSPTSGPPPTSTPSRVSMATRPAVTTSQPATDQPTVDQDESALSSLSAGHAVFGLIAVGLLAILALVVPRRR